MSDPQNYAYSQQDCLIIAYNHHSEYVFHLRKELVGARESKTAAEAEITRLQGVIGGLQDTLDQSMKS